MTPRPRLRTSLAVLLNAAIIAASLFFLPDASATPTDMPYWDQEPAPLCGSTLHTITGTECQDRDRAAVITIGDWDCPAGLSQWRLDGNLHTFGYADVQTAQLQGLDPVIEMNYGAWTNWCLPTDSHGIDLGDCESTTTEIDGQTATITICETTTDDDAGAVDTEPAIRLDCPDGHVAASRLDPDTGETIYECDEQIADAPTDAATPAFTG
ncbi:MAG: hypothetical protein AAF567_24360 [Actinomycetota bacterium]